MITKGRPWLQKQIKKIEETNSNFKDDIKKIKDTEADIFNEFNHWTPLKLTFLNFTLDVCAIVANKRFEKKNYIDLFAGSGINKTKGKYNDFLIGSPFIALLNHSKKFTQFFFCESNTTFCDVLKKRVNVLGLNANFYSTNYEYKLDEILNEIAKDKKSYNFFFIDPYGLEFSWHCMKKILNIRSDVLITFMTRNIWRSVKTDEATGNGHNALNRLFGDDSWKKANIEEDLIKIYKNNILKERSDAVILSTKIKSTKNFHYEMIFITHKTEGDNPWLNPIRQAKEEIENNTDEVVESLLDIIKKRQTTLC
ncbi:three-Cys-motif partner protein TcmP [Candidatus Pacearchaeota archaeon]|nr:three-Cys-motif partner protein TcmP [Candidatus Pacearchaeota archaeon]